MLTYIVRRILWIIPVLFFVSVITFVLMHAVPGGPWSREKPLPQATIDRLDEKYGLDEPIVVQYLNWVGPLIISNGEVSCCAGLLTGDLGPSYKYIDRSVNDIIADGILITVQLGAMAFLLSVAIGLPLGIIAALGHNKAPDYSATFISVIGISTPTFVSSILLIVVFGVVLGWLPTNALAWEEDPTAWILPIIALSLYPIAQIARYTRASMLEVTRRDYVRTAHSKGLGRRTVVIVHMIRNALIPVVTILGPILAFLITGSFVIEYIFSVPGIGRAYVTSISYRDYSMIMAMTMFYAVVIVMLNLLVDVLYAYIDPRIRYS
ncbi:MAG TPA: ABC transporter permease [Candidatus Limnocylindria bacterium]|nr:ABC transporter permease [Candidatus Limnocylindria bacterium]